MEKMGALIDPQIHLKVQVLASFMSREGEMVGTVFVKSQALSIIPLIACLKQELSA